MPRRIVRPLQQFLRLEVSGAIALGLAAVAALVWANLDPGGYAGVWDTELTITLGGWSQTEDLQHVVNDGLMAIFFLVIGIEVKRELTVGELNDARKAALPAIAALGGMVLPAAIFLAITAGGEGSEGWGIPLATDVAFALGALAALGRRAPPALVAFLLAVAVIDDIGAILVIALFYTDAIALAWLGAALAGLAAVVVAQRVHVRHVGVYVVLGILVWAFTFQSGVHATIAGVALGLLTPARPFERPATVSAEARRIAEATSDEPSRQDADAGEWRRLVALSKEAISPVNRVQNGLHQWSSFVVLPIFALANAGIVLQADALTAAAGSAVTLGVAAGLVLGKIVGLTGGALLALRLGLGRLPRGVRLSHVVGVGGLAGIGFTVSLFIADLSYSDEPDLLSEARIGILAASLVAAAVGVAVLLVLSRRARERDGASSKMAPVDHLPGP